MKSLLHFVLLNCFLLITACAGDPVSNVEPSEEQMVRLSDSEIKGLDPQKISDLASLRVAADQFEGLTRWSGAGAAEPGLADRWEISPDGLNWTFTLRSGLKFSDGTQINAELFPALLARLREPATASPTLTLFDNIKNIFAISSSQLRITLLSPDPQLPALLAHPAMSAIPLHLITERGDRWTTERPMVTSGAYRLESWRLNDHARLIRNPAWHETPAPVSQIVWKPMDDSLAGMRLFLAGGADVVADYPASRHQWLVSNTPETVRSTSYLGSYYFAFNTRKPPFDDVRVRRALSMAVEREWLADKVIGIGNVPAWNLLPPALTNGEQYRPDWASWSREQRLDEARKLLAVAGYGPDCPLRFEIRFNSSTEHRRVSVALASMWQPLGVEASLFNSEAALHFAALRSHDFALARSGWIADLPAPENFLTVHQIANGSGNYSGYANPAYDKLLARAIGTADPAARLELMREADRMIAEDVPVLPLYFYVTRTLVSKRIEGWQDNISNVHPSATLRISGS